MKEITGTRFPAKGAEKNDIDQFAEEVLSALCRQTGIELEEADVDEFSKFMGEFYGIKQ